MNSTFPDLTLFRGFRPVNQSHQSSWRLVYFTPGRVVNYKIIAGM